MKLAGRRFLIAGGFGLIGSHIADKLLEAGAAEVVLFDNGSVGGAETVRHLEGNSRVRMVQGDVLRTENVLDATDGIDGVFHAAAFITIPLAQRPVLGIDVNVRGIVNVLEACRIRGIKKIVYSSSIATFGNQKDGVVSEDAPYAGAGVQPASALYGIGKLMGEQLCALYSQKHGIDWLALRCATVYGERQHARGVNILPIVDAHDRIRQGLPPVIPGDGQEVHDYVYVGDVARGHVMAMEADLSGHAVTLATGQPTSFNEVVSLVVKACGSNLQPEHSNDRGRIKSAGATAKKFSIDKADKLLGWRPEVGLEEGIRRLIAWRDNAVGARNKN